MLKHCIASAAALLLMMPAAAVAQTPPAGQPQTPAQQEQRADQRQDGDMVIRADRLIGQAVRDRQDNRVGRIDDLALNLEEKKVAYAVISRGGIFGMGAETVAVPWKQVQPLPAERVVRFEGTEADLERARPIDTRTAWPADITPGEREAERPVATTGVDATHNVLSVSRLLGMDVQNQQGERLGQIDDIAIQRDGSFGYAVIAHGGFLGVGHNYVAVPWDRLEIDGRQERVTLNVTREQLEGAGAFEHRDRWPARVDWPFRTQ